MAQPPTPDPTRGVFETLLVVDGDPVELPAHLERLRASVERLYGQPLPDCAASLIRDGTRGIGRGRVRLDSRPQDGAIALAVKAVAIDPAILFPPRDRGPELRSQVIDGWHGEHKWADRRLLESLEADNAPATPLLVDRDGAVLETPRANVFVVRADGSLATPAADGRVLPGVARARAIALARAVDVEVAETSLTRSDLAEAREVFLTGSVRGVEPVRSIDGAPVGDRTTGLTETIALDMRQHWLGEHARKPSGDPAG
jgi:para-aminobenzoate synthetase / 4-amino-4-deoxychorismate lyase